jgi:hypothetical protein
MAPPTNSVTALLGRIRDEQRLARSLTNAMAATKTDPRADSLPLLTHRLW